MGIGVDLVEYGRGENVKLVRTRKVRVEGQTAKEIMGMDTTQCKEKKDGLDPVSYTHLPLNRGKNEVVSVFCQLFY